KSAQIREILISESAWEEMTCLFAPSLAGARFYQKINTGKFPLTYAHNQSTKNVFVSGSKVLKL
ncbi:hypothetical protein, partial [Escherichia coli]|uniref:hypothetical protein n=1 Tax=Escherichia coli TaxID=562 RepID=UPI00112F0E0E